MVHKLTTTASKGVIPHVFHRLRDEPADGFVNAVAGEVITSTQKTETYGGTGSVAPLTEKRGAFTTEDLRELSFQLTNIPYKSGFRVTYEELIGDKTGQVSRKVEDLRTRYFQHWRKLCMQLLIDNGTAYDGQAFFSASHAEHQSGTQTNLATWDVTTVAAPTDQEFADAVFEGIRVMTGLLDDQGEPLNEDTRSFVLAVPLLYMRPAMGALGKQNLTNGESNILLSIDGFSFTIVPSTRLNAWTDKFALIAANGSAFIRQEWYGPRITSKAEGSDFEHDTDMHEHRVSTSRDAGYDRWQDAVQIQLT